MIGITFKHMERLEELLIMANNEQIDYISKRLEDEQIKRAIRQVTDMALKDV